MASEWAFFGVAYLALELLGILAAFHAVLYARTAQGATAWAVALVGFPVIPLLLYVAIGRTKFEGYLAARAETDREVLPVVHRLMRSNPPEMASRGTSAAGAFRTLEKLAQMPFTGSNQGLLLIDGRATFDAILADIDAARRYVLVQFYIVRDDGLGRALQARLLAKLRDGVRVYFLYDGIGSYSLPRSYAETLKAAGAETEIFTGGGKRRNRFQINFRNHRKIVIVDGEVGFVGGHNVGDEYLGADPALSPWRDTHVQLRGPAVLGIQLSFVEDWYWVTHQIPDLDWQARPSESDDASALVIPSGPADPLETCGLLFVHAIQSARQRIWIVSPYFVPDEAVVSALQLAALRGVDVRILLPEKPDNRLVHLASFSYIEEIASVGVKVYRYRRGFLHQKVMLVDHNVAAIGTANLDNRSFRLNFEITVVFAHAAFAEQVQKMLESDFAESQLTDDEEGKGQALWFKVAARLARLLAPVL